MKLLIDIPEENYKLICSDGRPFLPSYTWIKNGTPIPDNATVCDIEQIRAEIEDLDTHYDNDYFSGNQDAMFKRNDVLQIIDHYTK